MRTKIERSLTLVLYLEQNKNMTLCSSPQNQPKNAEILATLRQEIQQFEGFKPYQAKEIRLGLNEIDQKLPYGSFPLSAIHEFISQDAAELGSTYGFVSALAGLIADGSAIVWITKQRSLFPHGLTAYGLEPHSIIFVEAKREQDALWAMEEALKCKGLACVIGEVPDTDLTATRRLQLMVEGNGTTGFLLRHSPKKTGTSSTVTRWAIKPLPSHQKESMPGVGFPRWDAELLRVRNGTPGRWQLEWRDQRFHLIEPEQIQHIPKSQRPFALVS